MQQIVMSSIISILIISTAIITTTMGQTPKVQFNVMEELPNGSLVGSIANKTKPFIQTNYTSLVYNYLKQSDAAKTLFSLNDVSGELFTLIVLDREYLCPYKVDCIYEFDVSVHSEDSRFFKTVTTQVSIDDINDNSPIFPVDEVTLKIFENSPTGYAVNIDTATDKDMGVNNGIQTYELLADQDSTDVFFLNVSRLKISGGFALKLILNKALDRETKDVYHVTVVAKDGGSEPKSGSVRITISVQDINDNTPEFANNIYNVSVNESAAVNETILKLSATDKDLGRNGIVTYRFSEFQNDKDILDHFLLDETTGELKVKSDLTGIVGNTYKVIAEAVDNGVENSYVSQAEVIINIDDSENNSPFISVSQLTAGNLGSFNVSENSVEETFVAYVNVDDPDKGPNGIVECSVSNNIFNIVALDKGYKIVVKGLLDREVTNYYNVSVSCFDHGMPAMSSSVNFGVHVTDVNDNTPIFQKSMYTAMLQENNKGNEVILQLSAVDIDEGNNAAIHYEVDNDAMGRFIVERNSGVVRVNAIFDRELEQNITFIVLAIDGGLPALTATAAVILVVEDQNDNAPIFIKSMFNFSVKENQSTGTYVGNLSAFDLDSGVNAIFDFSISPDYINKVPFILSPNGLLKANTQLDREETNKYDFVVIVIDHGEIPLNSTTRVTVFVEDLNDNYPVFAYPTPFNNTVIVRYPDFVNTFVITVQAYDLDEGTNKELQYSIEAGNDRRIFGIASINGTIFLESQLDIGSDLTVKLDISVKDKGNPPLGTNGTLFVELKYTNASFLASVQSESGKHIIISAVVVIVTLVISGVIIGAILFLRTLDKKRKHQETNDCSITIESEFGFVSDIQTQNISSANMLTFIQATKVTSADMLTSGISECYDPIKKKEVSFVMGTNDSFNYHQKSNGTSSFSIQPSKYNSAPDDHHSECSAEANCSDSGRGCSDSGRACSDSGRGCSDSGRGCSEEEDVFSTQSSDDPKSFDISTPESRYSDMYSQANMPIHTAVPVQTATGSYVKQPWTCKPHPAFKDVTSKCDNHAANRNLNDWQNLRAMPVDGVSSIHSNIVQSRPSWSGAYYGSNSSMDFSGTSAIRTVFDKTSAMIGPRDNEDCYSITTTTSGSYTIHSEDIL